MIQRIQSLYLAIVIGLMVTVLFSIYNVYLPFVVLAGISLAAAIATLLLFKARKVQLRLCIYNALILLGLQSWMAVFYFQNMKEAVFPIATVFPLISIILLLLAMRGIANDEALVQSYNRLRPKK